MGGGNNFVGNFLGQAKDKISATIFPKTAREILIDNINSSHQNMDKFFSESAPVLLKSKTVSEKDKAEIKKAVEAYNGSKSLISNLSKLEKEDKGFVKSVVDKIADKVFNLNAPTQPEPTNIPPQCHLECTK